MSAESAPARPRVISRRGMSRGQTPGESAPLAQANRERSVRDALLPYLRLVRAPAVFSALGDPLAGVLLDDERLDAGQAARLSAASALIYLAGMALNDLADREEDAR